jgi:prolyl-tRNA synthetase
MKDLYTFDVSQESALGTYQDVSAAYRAFFSDLKLPILVAEASSGDMGGDHSHEYHLANPIGEDTIATCSSCGYTANDEVAMARPSPSAALKDPEASASNFRVWRGISKDRKTLVNAWYPHTGQVDGDTDINIHAIKAVVPDIDASISDPLQAWSDALESAEAEDSTPEAGKVQLLNVIDSRLVTIFEDFRDSIEVIPQSIEDRSIRQSSLTVAPSGQGLNLLQLVDGDDCPRCETGSLKIQRALELGHTFLLGTRYSKPLEACVTLPQSPAAPVPVQMGCYGVGISRIFGTVAEHMADERGLMWPRAIAPFEVVVIPTSGVTQESLDFYDSLTSSSEGPRIDAVLDDRKETFGWKMRDADTTGYPVVVILGKAWREKGTCEVQCRTLSLKENVSVNVLSSYLRDLLAKL